MESDTKTTEMLDKPLAPGAIEDALDEDRRALLAVKPKMTRSQALANVRISRENYVTLVRCVYAQTQQETPQPLYIQYDGTEKQRDSLLCCIYSALPIDLSLSLSADTDSNSANTKSNIIFSQNAVSYPQYVIPATGENTVLVRLMARKIRNLGFVDYASNCESDEAAEKYLEELYRVSKSLAGRPAPNAKILKIAHQIITKADLASFDDVLIERNICDALSVSAASAPLAEAWLADLLDEANKRGLTLDEASRETLTEKFEFATDDRFVLNAMLFVDNPFKYLNDKRACKALLHADPEMFRLYYNLLIEDESGQALLDVYFAERLKASKGNWDDLHSALADSADLLARPETLEAVRHAAWERYIQELDLPGSKPVVLDAYMDVMRRMVSNPDKLEELSHKAMNAYWATKTLDQFDFGLEDEYNNFAYSTYPITGKYITLNRAKRKLETEGEESCLALINRSIEKYGQNYTEQELNEYRDFICENLNKTCRLSDAAFEIWVWLAFVTRSEAVYLQMLEIRTVLKERNYQRIPAALIKFEKRLKVQPDTESEELYKDCLYSLMLVICVLQDSEKDPVSLDTWLMLGRWICKDNLFLVFDRIVELNGSLPCVVAENPADVVKSCAMLYNKYCIKCAESYVEGNYAAHEFVSSLLKEEI